MLFQPTFMKKAKLFLMLILICFNAKSQVAIKENSIQLSPDGKTILCLLTVKPVGEKRTEDSLADHTEIFTIDVDSNKIMRLTYVGVDVNDAKFSPDGKANFIYILCNRDQPDLYNECRWYFSKEYF